MFHRRQNRPLRRVLGLGLMIGERPRQALREADRLKNQGQYSEAAEIYDRLIEAARARGMAERLADLLLQAGHSRLLAGEPDRALPLVKDGLEALRNQKNWRTLRGSGEMIVRELERVDQQESAAEIREWLDRVLPADVAPDSPQSEVTVQQSLVRRALPAKCPNCGANLRSDEVEWIDEFYVECPYCGSSIRLGAA